MRKQAIARTPHRYTYVSASDRLHPHNTVLVFMHGCTLYVRVRLYTHDTRPTHTNAQMSPYMHVT